VAIRPLEGEWGEGDVQIGREERRTGGKDEERERWREMESSGNMM